MKFIKTFVTLLAASTTFAIPYGKRQLGEPGVISCVKAIESAGCPVSKYVDEESSDNMCLVFNNNSCQKIYKKGVHNLPGCGNVDVNLISIYEKKIQSYYKKIESICRSKKSTAKKTTAKKTTTTKANAKATTTAPNNKNNTSVNVTSTTTVTTTTTTATTTTGTATTTNAAATTTLALGTTTAGLPTATPTVGGQIISGGVNQLKGSILLSTIGLIFYLLF